MVWQATFKSPSQIVTGTIGMVQTFASTVTYFPSPAPSASSPSPSPVVTTIGSTAQPWLDGSYLYPHPFPTPTLLVGGATATWYSNDEPDIDLESCIDRLQIAQSFNDFFVFIPTPKESTLPTIPVVIGSLTWTWGGSTIRRIGDMNNTPADWSSPIPNPNPTVASSYVSSTGVVQFWNTWDNSLVGECP